MKTTDFIKGVNEIAKSLNEELTMVTYDGEGIVTIKGVPHNQREYEKVMDKFRKKIAKDLTKDKKKRITPRDLEKLEGKNDGPHFNLHSGGPSAGGADEVYRNVNAFIKDESPMSYDDYDAQMEDE
jgi:hypothetical protein